MAYIHIYYNMEGVMKLLNTLCLLCSAALAGVWSEPEKILCENRWLIHIAVDNSGICWCEGWPWMYSYRSDEQGWQPEIELDSIRWGFPCFDKENTLWLLVDDMSHVTYTRYDGSNWSGVDTVPTYPSLADFAEMTADSSGGVWVGWTTDWWFWLDGAYNRYENGSWDAPHVLTDTLELYDHVIQAMTTGANGRVWVVWLNHGDVDQVPNESLESAYYDGDDWSEDILVCVVKEKFGDEGAFLMHGELDLAPDSKGGVWALWGWAYNDDVFSILVSYWNGEYWSQVDTIADAGSLFEASSPMGKIAVDEYGNAWAVWRQALEVNDKRGDIYYSVNSGSGWSEPAPVDTHPATDQYPDIAVDGAGRVWCVWASTRGDEWDIWASYTTSVSVAEAVTPSVTLSLTIDKSVGRSFTFRVSSPDVREELLIYDAGGRVVKRLAVNSGRTIRWDGTDMEGVRCASGVYFVRLRDEYVALTQRVVLIR
jgi:hypothetical protein